MSEQKLIEMISALLALDEKRALVPHGLGGHARELLTRSATALADYDALAAQRDELATKLTIADDRLRIEVHTSEKLGAQRDEGLAREAELRKQVRDLYLQVSVYDYTCDAVYRERDALQQRLAEAEKILQSKSEHVGVLADFTLQNCQGNGLAHAERAQQIAYAALKQQQVTNAFLASPGCADGENRIERGSEHGFEQSPNNCRHDEKSGVWWREWGVTRTGRECVACGHVDEDGCADGEQPS